MDDTIPSIFQTIESVVHLVSQGNTGNPVQINARQCNLLAKKASGTLDVLEEFRNVLRRQELVQVGPKAPSHDWTPAALELHRVLKDAEILIRDCCCDGQWMTESIKRGDLKETFAKLLYDIEWHTSVLCSIVVKSDLFEKSACDGKLGVTEHSILLSAAKEDRESLRQLLKTSHDCDAETCKPGRGDNQPCLAVQFLLKLDAEEEELADRSADLSKSPRFLWVRLQDLGKIKRIGSGGFSKVNETRWLGQNFAMKVFKDGTSYHQIFRQEIAAMAGLDHPNIVRVVCCSEDSGNLGIVMELMYKSLFDLLRNFKRDTHAAGAATLLPIVPSVGLMLQIAEGVRYLHSHSLAHRDLKSLNILLQFADPQTASTRSTDAFNTVHFTDSATPFIAKIADFGTTKMKHESTRRSHQTAFPIGTPAWMAPEVFKYAEGDEWAEPSPRFHPMKTDVYSFGLVCYEILSGKTPYADADDHMPPPNKREFRSLVKRGRRPKLPEEIPTRLAVLIQRCWDGNPRRRPDFTAICTELRYIKGLLIQGNHLALKQTAVPIGPVFDLKPEVKVQGPWGGHGGSQFSDGVVTSIKQMKLKYDDGHSPCIWYIEMEYDMNGASFVMGHGASHHGSHSVTIKIDEPNEYITQIEGWFGMTTLMAGPQRVAGVTSLTIQTNEKSYGPFGGESGTKFTSEYGRIIGFYGRDGLLLDQIGCFTAPAED